jgi:hypothetical protein
MSSEEQTYKQGPQEHFPEWRTVIAADESLSSGLREAYRHMIEGFVRFCQQRGRLASVAAARECVELLQLERQPGPAQLQEWKNALNWFFRKGKQREETPLNGVPPLARADLGKTEWEKRLVRRIRTLHFSWRTEQTYRGWACGMAS